MKIKQFTFDWVDKRDGRKWHATKWGKMGEDWKESFEEHPESLELKSCVVKEIVLEKGMEFISDFFDGWVMVIDSCVPHEVEEKYGFHSEIYIRDLEINGTGDSWEHFPQEVFVDWLNQHDYELKEVA